MDRHGISESISAAEERFFGYTEEEAAGKNVKLTMPSPFCDSQDEYIANYAQLVSE